MCTNLLIYLLCPLVVAIITGWYLHNFDKKLEKYKSEFDKLNYKLSVQFSYLHVERAKVLRGLYKTMVRLHEAMQVWITPLFLPYSDGNYHKEEDLKNRLADVGKYLNELHNFYRDNKILIANELQDKVESIINKLEIFCINYKTQKYLSENARSIDEEIKWMTQSQDYENELKYLKDIISKLEKEFQKLLAVEDDRPID